MASPAAADSVPEQWESDIQLNSTFLSRKDTLFEEHTQHIKNHPELKKILSDFTRYLLHEKPVDVFKAAQSFFANFGK